MCRVFFILVLLLAAQCVRAEQAVGLRSHILLASPAMEISELDSSWQNPSSGSSAQARASIETYFKVNNRLELGIEKRWHYLLKFSEDTAEFYSRLENNAVANGQYDLSLSINAATSEGFFAQYFIPLSSGIDFWIKAHVLKGGRVQKGELSGKGQVNDSSLSYDWQLDYAYDENRIFENPRKSASAWGYSFDLAMKAKLSDEQRLSASLEDLMYTLHWDKLDQDKGCLNRPLTPDCSVYTSRSTYTQRFPIFAKLQWAYDFEAVSATLETQAWQRYRALLLGIDYQGMQVEVDAINEMINLGYESTVLKVKWGFDKINFAQAKHWQLTLDMNWPIL
jgi:hypothetical protein